MLQATGGRQRPHEYNSLLREHYLRAAAGSDPLAAEDALGLTAAARRRIQQGLARAGFSPGPTDGVFGPATREAIRGWQTSLGKPATGFLDAVDAAAAQLLGAPVASAAAVSTDAPGPRDPRPSAVLVQQENLPRRVALLIGNSAYRETSPLTNPVNDATAMAAALRELRFDVTLEKDVDEDAMDDALADFEERSAGADMALVFYAGHGMELNGENYLVPVDARLASVSAVERETIRLDSVLAAISGARTKIVILDACRNNPFARTMRGAVRGANVRSGGLAPVLTGEGLLVAYAAAPGEVAADGENTRNSPYTAALLEHLRTPFEVRVMLGNVGGAVMASTGADQQPFVSYSLSGEHYLAGRGTQPVAVANDSSLREQETVFWQSIVSSANAADFEAYLRQYPAGAFRALATNRLAALRGGAGRRTRPRVGRRRTGRRDGRREPCSGTARRVRSWWSSLRGASGWVACREGAAGMTSGRCTRCRWRRSRWASTR